MSNLKHELRQMFDNKKSVNLFDDTELLEEGLLERIVNLSLLNPSVFPLQPWNVLAIKSSLSKHKLASFCNNDDTLLHSAVCLIILRDAFPPADTLFAPTVERQLLKTALMYACKYYAVNFHVIDVFDAEGIRRYFHVDSSLEIELLVCLGYFGGTCPLLPNSAVKRYSQTVKEI